jgi:site-specific recombinase XerD
LAQWQHCPQIQNMLTMKNTSRGFEDLTVRAGDCLLKNLGRSRETVKHYNVLWRKIHRYMLLQNINTYSASVGESFLLEQFGMRDYCTLSKNEKDIVRAINVLSEFVNTGRINPLKERTDLHGPIGCLMELFLSHKKALRLKDSTIHECRQHLSRFFRYLDQHGITDIKTINHFHVLDFLKDIDARYATLPHMTLRSIRGFFRYMYQNGHIDIDTSRLIPKDNYRKQADLPSTYSKQEIESMLKAIDRTTSTGKRNYAVVLLAARLGMRASDIANLEFNNLDWEQNTIVFDQFKTGKRIVLPMLADVGNAIIDYLKHARPKSDCHSVFLLCRSPHTPMQGCSVTGIVHRALIEAGVNIQNKRHGSHALRHSLAGILLEQKATLPVIAEVLGHKNTESTRYYLRIDLQAMKQCALEVPPVAYDFYQQGGGYFYE